MAGRREAFEPSDWSFPPLREVDALLRCPICKEYLSNAVMVTPCSHNFCSYCIRRDLRFRHQCPTCFKSFNESDLCKNQQLDHLVHTFTSNREGFLSLVSSVGGGVTRTTSPPSTAQYRVPLPPPLSQLPDFTEESQALDSDDSPPTTNNPTSLEARRASLTELGMVSDIHTSDKRKVADSIVSKGRGEVKGRSEVKGRGEVKHCSTGSTLLEDNCFVVDHSTVTSQCPVGALPGPESGVSTDVSISAEPLRESTRGSHDEKSSKVSCPVCGKLVLSTFINSHLDGCLTKPQSLTARPYPPRATPPTASKANPKLPNFVYSVMKDRELRSRLKTYGLPTQGSRRELTDRLREFVLRYNSQCDSAHPKSMREVAAEVERGERNKALANRGAPPSIAPRRRSTDPCEIEQQNKAHEKMHKDQFDQLIAQARKSRERHSGPAHSRSADSAKETLSNQTTPPLSPLATVTSAKITTPIETPTSGATPTQGGDTPSTHVTLATPRIHGTPQLHARRLTTPSTSNLTTPTRMTSSTPKSATSSLPNWSSRVTKSAQSVSNGVCSENESFDDLSPLEDFDPYDSQAVQSGGSTPELLTVRGEEVLAPDSPEGLLGAEPSASYSDGLSVPESPSILTRPLGRKSKRKHPVRYAPVVAEQDDLLSSPKRKKKRKL